jgi:predicted dehydrogenase
LKILIAGLGSIGRRHLRNLLALGERDIILYRSGRSTLPDGELEPYPVFHDLGQALDQKPEAVIIANPTAVHLDVAIPAAEAGCSILLEKPVSHTLGRVDELALALQRGGGRLLVGYQFRFHPGLQKVSSCLCSGSIGRPLSTRAHWGEYLPDWHPWEDYRQGYSARQDLGGGVILTLSHTIDYLNWFFGPAGSCWAFTNRTGELELDVEDTAEIGLRYRSDVLGSLHMNFLQRPPAHHLEITGSRGSIRWDNATGETQVFSDGEPPRKYSVAPGFERNTMFVDQMKHFIDAARGEAQPVCTLEDGIEALRVALAALESAKVGVIVNL